jgi:excisionase family DNA binding protein
MKNISIGKVCELLGISLSTAYRWIKLGKLIEEFRTIGNHRRFNLFKIENQFINKEKLTNPKVAIYARVSSHDQKLDLERQKNKLLDYCKNNNYTDLEVITDLGSGLNYKKSGLNKLISLILTRKINLLVLNHKDRLLRFGSELIFKLCEFNHIKVIILEEKILSFEEDLTHNVIELMTVFCAKLYGKRSHKNKVKNHTNIILI